MPTALTKMVGTGAQHLSVNGIGVKTPSAPLTTGTGAAASGAGVAPNSALAGNTVAAASKVPGVGGSAYSNSSHIYPPYRGAYKDFGSVPYPGLTNKQVDFQITDTNGAASDKWVLFDYSGLSNKTTATSIAIGVNSNVLISTTTAAYTALKSYYATSGVTPLFNSLRIQGDSSSQIANPINFTYYDENSEVIQTKQVTPSNAFNQGDYQNAQGEFGIQAAITPNFAMYGSVNSTASTTNYIYFTFYIQDYVGDRYYAGAR